ncbi:lipid-binding SYLF domain-containing protein [Maribacter sp. MMG018]|uniref:lipid-binding SYLF domain-containing protein n=1 Tax=Maribacter sp. MMG018 TaxID=2822688 RepID=UPI001B37EA6B|nr:lipid-binding SYLF domain-containing protein [Maribacter sp. MMG018]MBQ4914568.1 lipid-binding SYLF domain-containing protein [Maribacter sp. MMG018]
MKKLKSITVLSMVLAVSVATAQTKNESRIAKDAVNAKKELIANNPNFENLFKSAVGFAIFPNVGKGGLIVGGASGKGVLVEKGMLTGILDMKKLNIGMQAGAQSTVEVLFFETQDDLDSFKKGNYEFGAEASAIVLKSGVGVNAQFKDGIAAFIYPKAGLMADASIGGQKFRYNAL